MKKVLYPLLLVVGFCALMFGLTTLFHSSAGACVYYSTCASCYPTMCEPDNPCCGAARDAWDALHCGNWPC